MLPAFFCNRLKCMWHHKWLERFKVPICTFCALILQIQLYRYPFTNFRSILLREAENGKREAHATQSGAWYKTFLCEARKARKYGWAFCLVMIAHPNLALVPSEWDYLSGGWGEERTCLVVHHNRGPKASSCWCWMMVFVRLMKQSELAQ